MSIALTIPNGAARSNWFALAGGERLIPCWLALPAALTGTQLFFEHALTAGEPAVGDTDARPICFPESTTVLQIPFATTTGAGLHVPLTAGLWTSIRWLRIATGVPGTLVNQGAERTFILGVRGFA